MATPNYKHQKKQREQAQRMRQEEKEKRKANRKGGDLPVDKENTPGKLNQG